MSQVNKKVSSLKYLFLMDKRVLLLLSGLGLFVGFLRINFSQDEDMGMFTSISSFVANGYKLYSEIYDIKDPFFFYSAAISLRIFGTSGPFLIDLFLIFISAPLAYVVAKSFGLARNAAVMSSLTYLLVLTGSNYQAFRSQIFAITLILLCTLLIQNFNFFASGYVAFGIIAFKMPLFIFFIGLIPLAISLKLNFKNWTRMLFGFLTSFVAFLLILVARGELEGYVQMVKDNILYSRDYQSVVGLPTGVIGHLEIWNRFQGSAVALIFMSLLLTKIYLNSKLKNKVDRNIQIYAWGSVVSTYIFLGLTALWPHHMQILCLPAFALMIQTSNLIFPVKDKDGMQNPRSQNKSNLKFDTSLQSTKLSNLIVLILLIIIPLNLGAAFDFKSRMSIASWANHSWRFPPEVEMLNNLKTLSRDPVPFTRLGMNDDLSLGAFLDHSKWHFSCSRYGIVGMESKLVVDQFNECIKNEVEVITLAPMFFNQNRPGVFVYYKEIIAENLSKNFNCQPMRTDGYQLCIRKDSKVS